MKKVRSRLTISVFILVIASSILSLIISALTRNGVILVRDQIRYMLFGYALRDVLLLVFAMSALIVSVFVVSRNTTSPIVDVTNAMREVAAGNFDVEVSLRENVEELGELQRGFNLMTRDLKSNAYLRRDFISNVSHELKTPLTIINGYARLIEEGDLSEAERAEYAGFIAGESDRLIKLTSNMLRLSKMDGANVAPATDTFMLDEQIRSAILLLEPKWSAKGISVNVDLPDVTYVGDADLLSQVWANLFENAVKYNREGGNIDVSMTKDLDGVSVIIADSGDGMSPETMEHMFEMFYQGDTSRKKDGSGLGLSIVKRIVEIHGGSVSVTSMPGTGSVFSVALPRTDARY